MAKNITLSIPDELHKKMKKMSEIRWSEIVRQVIEQRVHDLEMMNKITAKSKFTKRDIEKLSKKIKEGIAKQHGLI